MLSRFKQPLLRSAVGGLSALQHGPSLIRTHTHAAGVGAWCPALLTTGRTQTGVRCFATDPSRDTNTARQVGSYVAHVSEGIAKRERVTLSDSITTIKKKIKAIDATLNAALTTTYAEMGQVREELGALRDSVQSLLDNQAGDQRGALEQVKTAVCALQLKVQEIYKQGREERATPQSKAQADDNKIDGAQGTAATEEGTPSRVVKTHCSDFQATIDAIHETVRRHGGTLFTDIEASQVLKAGDIHLNVGGRTVVLAPDALALPALANTYLAHLLLRHMSALPRITMDDGRQLPFLDASPMFGTWLEYRVAMAQLHGTFHGDLRLKEKCDESIRFYHEKLIRRRLLADWSAGITDAAKALTDVRRFYREVGGLLSTVGDNGPVKTAHVRLHTAAPRPHIAATLEATLKQSHVNDKELLKLFNDKADCTDSSPPERPKFHLQLDVLRRTRLSPPGRTALTVKIALGIAAGLCCNTALGIAAGLCCICVAALVSN
ncbi:unnamed protein product [Vitrella brassicaformis CCMP3155]|uniref:Uncharacterized protein n=1 Tax=Vitrella brassicaformis (strain CCMP3155) TaxID=1169540 RepID=A0A0G4FBC5_VITBC|nr:unnamed protein product [Vitrella brassicaformis CCMP3155]|eukprot:CEM10179.1 unnamed protein product [Vitrella brassicaformis CCMP3155]